MVRSRETSTVLSPCDECGLEAEFLSNFCEAHGDQSCAEPARLTSVVGVVAGSVAVVVLLIAARVLLFGGGGG